MCIRDSTKTLERELAKHPLIDQVECYKTPSGKLCIEVTQRLSLIHILSKNIAKLALPDSATIIAKEVLKSLSPCPSPVGRGE